MWCSGLPYERNRVLSLIGDLLCVCVCVGGGGVGGKGTEEVIHLFQTVCVCGVGGWGGGTGNVIHLFQTALKNLANNYFHFGQFLILSPVV